MRREKILLGLIALLCLALVGMGVVAIKMRPEPTAPAVDVGPLGPRFRYRGAPQVSWEPADKLWRVKGDVENLTTLHWQFVSMRVRADDAEGNVLGWGSFFLSDFPSGQSHHFETVIRPDDPPSGEELAQPRVELLFFPGESVPASK